MTTGRINQVTFLSAPTHQASLPLQKRCVMHRTERQRNTGKRELTQPVAAVYTFLGHRAQLHRGVIELLTEVEVVIAFQGNDSLILSSVFTTHTIVQSNSASRFKKPTTRLPESKRLKQAIHTHTQAQLMKGADDGDGLANELKVCLPIGYSYKLFILLGRPALSRKPITITVRVL